MRASRWHWLSLFLTLASRLQALNVQRQALASRIRFGITSRLVIALVGVAALVLAANVIVQQGILVERTTRITQIAPPPAVPPKPTAALPKRRVESALVPVVREQSVVSADPLLVAIDRFERAAQDRTAVDTDQAVAEYQRSTTDLDHAVGTFTKQVGLIAGHPFGKLNSRVASYKEHGDDLVLAADRHRAILNEYSTIFEGLNDHVNTSLQGAWTIFGRVIARRSLLQLSADLDNLRRSFPVIGAPAKGEGSDVRAPAHSEQEVVKTLERNEKEFRGSQTDPWYTAMHDGVMRLMVLRESLSEGDHQLGAESQEFTEEAASLSASIPRTVEVPLVSHIKRSVPRPAILDNVAHTHPLDVPDRASVAATAVVTHSVTTASANARQKRLALAAISVGVLVLLIFIALGTVWSIVRPVRLLLIATTRLAQGDNAVRVPRGGIKELDTLAVAFNAMSDELTLAKAIARDYQRDLEAKVIERTQQLEDLAKHDPLTGLPNRRELFVLLKAAIERARAVSHWVGVFFLDVDNFKYLNDSLGHAFGDRVLMALAQRLQEVTRPFGFAARLGGDEFTVVFECAQCVEDIKTTGLSVVQAFHRPLSVDGRDLVVSVSVGASVYPDHEQGAEALLQAADAALFRAKALGRSQLSMFTPELLEVAAARFKTEQGVRRAIEKGEFELLFQPEVLVETLQTVLVEALIRWRMPDGTVVSPHQFLAIAEESGLINEIGDWVLRSAIEAAAHWHHGAWPEARVAINVSPRQLLDHRFDDRLCELLQTYRLPARCIEIELTESVLQTGQGTIDALRRLRAHGVAIALDDFGTGYSSLASLDQLPLSRIKLDRSLIADIDTNPRSAALARAIIAMCQVLGLEITAEGVERPEQVAVLLDHPSMYLQGYLLAYPVSRDQLLSEMSKVTGRAHELLIKSRTEVIADRDQVAVDSFARSA